MRVTAHHGRVGKDGVYSRKHNDRNFDASNSEHIDTSLSSQNATIKWDVNEDNPTNTFEECEIRFYEEWFSEHLEAQNKRNEKCGHAERNTSVLGYLNSPKTCPEETILEIGNRDENVGGNTLARVANDLMKWEMETFPNIKILDVAVHVDEPESGPHLHERKVWVAKDKDGYYQVSQTKALREMGIEPPDPTKPIGRYNNPKMTYTTMVREKFIELCQEYGLEVETEPKDPSESGRSLLQVKVDTLTQANEELEVERTRLTSERNALKKTVDENKVVIETQQETIDNNAEYMRQLSDELDKARKALKSERELNEELKATNESLTSEIAINKGINEREIEATGAILEAKSKASIIKEPGFFNRNDETVTYHKNTRDDISKIRGELKEALNKSEQLNQKGMRELTQGKNLKSEYEDKLALLNDKLEHLDQFIQREANSLFSSAWENYINNTRNRQLNIAVDALRDIHFEDGTTGFDYYKDKLQEANNSRFIESVRDSVNRDIQELNYDDFEIE